MPAADARQLTGPKIKFSQTDDEVASLHIATDDTEHA